MKTFIVALAIFLLAMLGMALGVIFGKRCLRGSCGGPDGLRDSNGQPLCERCKSLEEAAAHKEQSAESVRPL
jgi:hypothetical protein